MIFDSEYGSYCVLCFLQEYNVRASASTDKSYFIGRFVTGLLPFSKKKHAENKWTLHKDGLQGRQLTDSLRVIVHHLFSGITYAF